MSIAVPLGGRRKRSNRRRPDTASAYHLHQAVSAARIQCLQTKEPAQRRHRAAAVVTSLAVPYAFGGLA